MTRKAFEAWIGNPPYERMCDRGSPESAWPGQYKNYEVQLAWEAWQAASKQQREKDAEICTNQKYMVLQPMRTYSAEDLCSAQKDSAKTLAKMILAQGKK